MSFMKRTRLYANPIKTLLSILMISLTCFHHPAFADPPSRSGRDIDYKIEIMSVFANLRNSFIKEAFTPQTSNQLSPFFKSFRSVGDNQPATGHEWQRLREIILKTKGSRTFRFDPSRFLGNRFTSGDHSIEATQFPI